MVRISSSGSVTSSTETYDRSGPNTSTSRWATSRASRLFPIPPAPLSVRSRVPPSSSSVTAEMSGSRPTVGFGGRGGELTVLDDSSVGTTCAASKRSLSRTAASSCTSPASSAGVSKCRYDAESSDFIRSISFDSRSSRSGAGVFR